MAPGGWVPSAAPEGWRTRMDFATGMPLSDGLSHSARSPSHEPAGPGPTVYGSGDSAAPPVRRDRAGGGISGPPRAGRAGPLYHPHPGTGTSPPRKGGSGACQVRVADGKGGWLRRDWQAPRERPLRSPRLAPPPKTPGGGRKSRIVASATAGGGPEGTRRRPEILGREAAAGEGTASRIFRRGRDRDGGRGRSPGQIPPDRDR
jgi:hypothetical protein